MDRRRAPVLALALLAFVLFATQAGSAAAVRTCPDGEPVSIMPPGAAVAQVPANDAVRITIHTQAGGLGGVRKYDGLIAWKEGDGFVRTDGRLIPFWAVRNVLHELSMPMAAQFDFSQAGFDRAYLRFHLDAAEAYLQQARSLSAVRAAFEKEYFDAGDFEKWVASEFDPCDYAVITDYYPHLSVTITAGSRNVRITSGSQRGFMLPLWITDERGTRPTFNPGLARAIASLLPADAPLHDALTEKYEAENWGEAITRTPAVIQAIGETGTTREQARRIAHSMGLGIEYDVSADAASWSGSVWLRAVPWVRYTLSARRSSIQAFAASLMGPKMALQSLARAHWLIDALRRSRIATATASDASSSKNSNVNELYRAGLLAAGGRLAGDSLPATEVEIADGTGGESWWFVLDDGDMLLDEFEPETTSFPFGKLWYDRVAGVHLEDRNVLSGAVVSPAGTLLQLP